MIEVAKFQKLSQTRTPEQQEKKLKEVGELYEKHFLREMVKAMRSTVSEGGFVKAGQAEKIFREQLDQEYVEKWGEKGGIGLADLIFKQLVEKFGARLGITQYITRPKGPLPLDEKSNYQGRKVENSQNPNKMTLEFMKDLDQPSLGINSVQMPWEGKLMGSTRLGSDEHLLEIEHKNGLKSQIVFKGQPLAGIQGHELKAGERIALLSPEARAFFWNVEPVSKTVSK